ncbi:histidine kinase dimerization/phospho-acceptor domain-containing protein [Ferrovum sp.]|jgi:signal transduction histidine kinase|uniref:histidine kinase dimerization/phospho-acceptor domain-containing protein n=2 Tax=Ferrovum sp. TaxID=2609467 RepID=UPI00262AC09E|nr:histidine kinase dimerization/phospho-acceptor domain-containing protein [Ferrovum sp.]
MVKMTSSLDHELRTPLAAIQGFVALLQEGGVSASEEREYLLMIARSAQRLQVLLDQNRAVLRQIRTESD